MFGSESGWGCGPRCCREGAHLKVACGVYGVLPKPLGPTPGSRAWSLICWAAGNHPKDRCIQGQNRTVRADIPAASVRGPSLVRKRVLDGLPSPSNTLPDLQDSFRPSRRPSLADRSLSLSCLLLKHLVTSMAVGRQPR